MGGGGSRQHVPVISGPLKQAHAPIEKWLRSAPLHLQDLLSTKVCAQWCSIMRRSRNANLVPEWRRPHRLMEYPALRQGKEKKTEFKISV